MCKPDQCEIPTDPDPIFEEPIDDAVCEGLPIDEEVQITVEPPIRLSQPVGSLKGRTGNLEADVKAVQARLSELGMTWIPTSGACDEVTIACIRLFQAMVQDRKVSAVDGRIDPGGSIEKILWDVNAPAWVQVTDDMIPGVSHKPGNGEPALSSWAVDVLRRAAARFVAQLNAEKKPMDGSWNLVINGGSLARGGNTPHHSSHEAGRDIDIHLFTSTGSTDRTDIHSKNYDREWTERAIQTFLDDEFVKLIYFNDSEVIADHAGMVKWADNHHHHFHVCVGPRPASAAAQQSDGLRYNKKLKLSKDEVEAIQRKVGVEDDGALGKDTVEGVKKFQTDHGLPADGKLDEATRAALDAVPDP